ncbi:SemiSWEET transporter [Flavicella sp.]|uniref:SemiSWEET transporter n=1 Tax=Flavicella sp. TaxID=2957742 RepID=UPI0026103DC8|nr:SemiSWEET transporter [Flavicella sp.]MDG1806123.1 SemiSWEET transporter [Flavicella sp.]MDG2279176.1 SemiSWEET transporter [Flavicella sp.]
MEVIPIEIEIIGLVAASLTTVSFVPQVYKIWKTKSAESISLAMFLMFFVGVLLWLVYGIFIKSVSMTIANTITASLAMVIIYYKIKLKD